MILILFGWRLKSAYIFSMRRVPSVATSLHIRAVRSSFFKSDVTSRPWYTKYSCLSTLAITLKRRVRCHMPNAPHIADHSRKAEQYTTNSKKARLLPQRHRVRLLMYYFCFFRTHIEDLLFKPCAKRNYLSFFLNQCGFLASASASACAAASSC